MCPHPGLHVRCDVVSLRIPRARGRGLGGVGGMFHGVTPDARRRAGQVSALGQSRVHATVQEVTSDGFRGTFHCEGYVGI